MAGSPLQDRLLDCTDPARRGEAMTRAAEAVGAGKVVVLPTDTVYGVGADAFDVVAVAMVLAAKHRGREMPPPVLVPSPRTVDGLAIDVPMYAKILMRQFWPGPLTVVLRAQPSLRWDLGETNGTVALRMPDDDVALTLLTEVGPMAVTSANLTGQPAATTGQEALDQLGGAVAVYLDDGPRSGGLPSTIVDCTGEEPVLLRVGALSPEEIRGVLGTTVLHDAPPVAPEGEPQEDVGADAQQDVGLEPQEDVGAESQEDVRAESREATTDEPPPAETHARLVGGILPSGVPVPASAVRTLAP
ncbi:L-threonylcarbamoyladenylate synthase [Ornithinimicrobium cerasi]|uniref:L-threonylcarbamoyladenylate synthase n=1 Tax=Ornithinimicrobium cerasi TaxID=2248773 RepID=A0A285VFF9_9MICO|nr:L-threonylcarbamoyladenylate synthase [Ornithinimicrobium cerasi]SOC52799.1 translation factor SUA5 [Ornithinimicrobium cerasi]